VLKIFLLTLIFLFPLLSHGQTLVEKTVLPKLSGYEPYVKMITEEELSAQLHFIASDFFEGRKAGSRQERAIAYYLASCYKALNVPPFGGGIAGALEDYFQSFPLASGSDRLTSQNVIAFIEGTDPQLKSEVVVLIAHYDHLGVGKETSADSIFNGAADDGSGTVALLEMAESFIEAKRHGSGTKRSLLFLHTGAEETGMVGSSFYVANPVVPLPRISAVVNLDGVGGSDKPGSPLGSNYVYLLYNDSTSLPLAELTRDANNARNINLQILKPENPNRFNSDNKPFEYELIPSVYFSTGLTEHYHKASDEPGAIDYNHMTKIVKLIFTVTTEFADRILNKPSVTRTQFEKTGNWFCIPCGCASDARDFTEPGICPDCNMRLQPQWKKKDR